jgi:hypothetical protein
VVDRPRTVVIMWTGTVKWGSFFTSKYLVTSRASWSGHQMDAFTKFPCSKYDGAIQVAKGGGGN